MKGILLASALAFGMTTTVAMAETVNLTNSQMDEVRAGKIEPVKVNGGGKTPKGSANGVPTVNLNPAGHAPGGHN